MMGGNLENSVMHDGGYHVLWLIRLSKIKEEKNIKKILRCLATWLRL